VIGQLNGKVVIITGAAQGIGAAIARVFSSAGAHVVLSDIAVDLGRKAASDICAQGGNALFLEADISHREQVNNLVQSTVEQYGKLDIVIHNAASFAVKSAEDMSEEYLDKSLSVILKPAFWLTQEALPHFRKQGAGRLIFTSSVSGPTVATPGIANYCAAKSGINGLVKAAAVELAKDNITVNAVEPGFIKTDAMDLLADEAGLAKLESYIPKGHMGRPEDIANTMLFFASDEASYVTGQSIIVDGGSTLVESAALLDR